MRNPRPAQRLQAHEGEVFSGGSSAFWITNPDNILRYNHGADAQGNGFWFSFPHQPLGVNKQVPIYPNHVNFGVFEHNISHSNHVLGIQLDWVPINDAGEIAPEIYEPTVDESLYDYHNGTRMTMQHITVYKNGMAWEGGAFWNRVTAPDYLNWVSADNVGTFFAGAGMDGLIKDSLVIGQSLNQTPSPRNEASVAFASYHSTFSMRDNIVVNFPLVLGEPSGAFRTDDYYLIPVDKGPIRNGNNRLINSHPGLRTLPFVEENWALAGALWDPHGYWGIAKQYWVYDDGFFTSESSCQAVEPAGHNGMSCPGPYYGVGMFVLDRSTDPYVPMTAIEVIRQNAAGAELGRWTVGDGELAPRLGHMRHFAAAKGGYYRLRFPDWGIPQDVALSISNAYRQDDHFLLAVSFDGGLRAEPTSPPTMTMKEWPNVNNHPRKQNYQAVSSFAAVRRTPNSYWQDSSRNLVWLHVQGGVAGQRDQCDDAMLDQDIYQEAVLRVFAQ
ncbi:MAG: hypothetical protein R2865_14670 [Deinococcales bacterium]